MPITVFDEATNTSHTFDDGTPMQDIESIVARGGVAPRQQAPQFAQAALPILGQISQQIAQPTPQSSLPSFKASDVYGLSPQQVTAMTDQVQQDKFAQMRQKLIQQQQLKDEMEREKDRAATIKLETQRTKNQFAIQKAKVDAQIQKQKLDEQRAKVVGSPATGGGTISQAEGYKELWPAPDKYLTAQGGIRNVTTGEWDVPPGEPKGSGAKEEKPVQMKRIVIAPDGSQVEETFWDLPSKYTSQSPLKSQKPPSASVVPKPGSLSDVESAVIKRADRLSEDYVTEFEEVDWGFDKEKPKPPYSYFLQKAREELAGFGQQTVPRANVQPFPGATRPTEQQGAQPGVVRVFVPGRGFIDVTE